MTDKERIALVEIVSEMMQLLTDDERMEVMRQFCAHCGTTKLPCQCANDD